MPGAPDWHEPAWQVSPTVSGSLSSLLDPLARSALTQTPLMHMSVVHCSASAQSASTVHSGGGGGGGVVPSWNSAAPRSGAEPLGVARPEISNARYRSEVPALIREEPVARAQSVR